MDSLVAGSPWQGPARFFEEFRELSQQQSFAAKLLPDSAVEMSNPVCGDQVWVWVEVQHERVVAYAYRQRGCWPVAGCLELWGHLLGHLTVPELLSLRISHLLGLVLDVPPSKRHAFSLTLRAVQMAIVEGHRHRTLRSTHSNELL